MADPIKVLRSLDRLANQYTVFEPDQVLTHSQLNSVSSYLDDQDRLTRVALLGVGIVAGLRVGLADGSVRVTRGLGLTTDGDLLMLAADTLYDRFRPYDTTAPAYAPFYRDVTGTDGGTTSQMLSLVELVPVGESDVLAGPLSQLPGGALADKVVLMLMESVVNDPDLCSGTDCDNLGRDALHRVRLLLIGQDDAAALMKSLPALQPASERAAQLPELAADRPVLGRDIATTGTLAARYRDAANRIAARLAKAFSTLPGVFPEILDELFGSDPTGAWIALLQKQRSGFDGTDLGLQPWYDYLKDLVDTWNGLRTALLADDSVVLPDVGAFPKHLFLGLLSSPRQWRTALYPAPLDALAREQSAHARFLAWKLHVLVNAFDPPADTTLRVTPSFGEDRPLEDRAIPWHYRLREDLPVQVGWSFRLSARDQGGANLGYRAASWAQTERARAPLAFGIGANDFFRVEGHLGRPVEDVSRELNALIAANNLPFEVQPVLLHNDRSKIRVRPPIRYTPLHTLQYLVRQDVATRLEDGAKFGEQYLADVNEAVAQRDVIGSTDSGESVVGAARAARDSVASTMTLAAPALALQTYSAYQADAATNVSWKASYASTLDSVGNARINLGNVSRADFTSPFDNLMATNQPHWIDWLDTLIQAGNDRADDKLLFSAFVQRHPGIDHLGGTWRGGSLVLVYDDAGKVVADFALGYPCAEEDLPEPVEPPLTRPPYRPPVIIDKGLRVIPSVAKLIDDRFVNVRAEVQKDLLTQSANIDGLVKGAFVQKSVTTVLQPPDVKTGDLLLDQLVRDVSVRQTRVQDLNDLASRTDLSPDVRDQVMSRLKEAQTDLATAVGDATTRVVTQKVDVASGGAADVSQVLTNSLGLIRDPGAVAQLGSQLGKLDTAAAGSQKVLVGNLRVIGGFR
jgi:hypothetical protein